MQTRHHFRTPEMCFKMKDISALIERKRSRLAKEQERLEQAATVLDLLPARDELEARLARARQEQQARIEERLAKIQEIRQQIRQEEADPEIGQMETELEDMKRDIRKKEKILKGCVIIPV